MRVLVLSGNLICDKLQRNQIMIKIFNSFDLLSIQILTQLWGVYSHVEVINNVNVLLIFVVHESNLVWTLKSNIFYFAGGSEPRLVDAAIAQLKKLPFYHSFWNRTTLPSLVFIYFCYSWILEDKIKILGKISNLCCI